MNRREFCFTASTLCLVLLAISPSDATGQSYPFFHYNTSDGLAQNAVTALVQDSRGFLWIGSEESGVSRFDGTQFVVFDFHNAGIKSPVHALACDGRGRLFIGTARGIRCMMLDRFVDDRPDSVMNMFLSSISAPVVRLVFQTPDELYAESENEAWLITISKKNIRPIAVRVTELALPAGYHRAVTVRAKTMDCRGREWYATDKGLLSDDKGRCNLYDRTNGLRFDDIRIVLADREGNIWCGTNDGLSMLVPDRIMNMTLEDFPAGSHGVWGMAAAPDNSIWLGMIGSGAVNINGGRKSVFDVRSGLSSNFVSSIIARSSAQVIFGTMNGVVLMDGKKKRAITTADGLPDNRVECIIPSKFGGYWISTHSGLVRWKDTGMRVYTISDGLSSNRISQIAEDKYGDLWIGTHEGACTISHISPERVIQVERLEGIRIVSVYIDDGNHPWFGTVGSGVYAFYPEGLLHITKDDDLAGNTVYFVTQDNYGAFYFGTNAGISVLPASDVEKFLPQREYGHWYTPPEVMIPFYKSVSMFTLTDKLGLVGNEMNSGAVLRDSAGNLWFGCMGGVSRYVPMPSRTFGIWRSMEQKAEAVYPQIILRQIRIDGNDVPYSRKIEMGPSNSIFTVACALPSYRNPGSVKYYYHLEGLEYSWHESHDGTFSYASLPAGNYRLCVQATIGEGIYTRQTALFEIVVHPPFHQTGWFWALALLFAGCAGYGVHRNRTRRVLEIERMRTRIASDLHDDLGATLSSISLIGDMERNERLREEKNADRLDRISELARHAVLSISDIVWAVNPAKDSIGAVADRMEYELENAMHSKPIQTSLLCEADLRKKILRTEARSTVMLIFKEAIHNALKHSACTSIEVSLQSGKRSVLLAVRDNGCGFDPARAYNGNGLSNMRARAHHMKWMLEIRSSAAGTVIELEFNA